MKRIAHILIVVVLGESTAWVWPQAAGGPSPSKTEALTRGPYCGLYSLYAAATSLGIEAEFSSLLRPEFVSGQGGSTAQDLCNAAASLGLHALAVDRLSADWLRSNNVPALLHVRATLDSPKADHWVFLSRTAGGSVTIQDPPHLDELESVGSLAARWDGVAVLLSRSPIDAERLRGPQRIRLIGPFSAIALAASLASAVPRFVPRRGRRTPHPLLRNILVLI
jgi:hypothetical protein